MIKLIARSQEFKSNFIFTDFFPNQSLNMLLMIHHTQDGKFYEKLNNYILDGILNLRLNDLENDKIEESLKEYFIALNWQINTKMRKFSETADGLSLILIIIKNDTLYMIQFGRLLAAISENDKFIQLGRSWEYFKVKNKKELNLLGYEDRDINVKIIKKEIIGTKRIMIISSEVADRIDPNNLTTDKASYYLKKRYDEMPFLYSIFDVTSHKMQKVVKTTLRKRIKITLAIMIALIIVSSLYVYFGKNWIQNKQEELKEKNSAYIRDKLLQNLLEKQNQLQEIADQILKKKIPINIFTTTKIGLKKGWELDLPDNIVKKPLFDIKNIYLFSKNKIYAINKLTRKTVWIKVFKDKIKYCELIDANRLIIAGNDSLFCLKRSDAQILWSDKQHYSIINSEKTTSLFFALNEYNKLDSGIIAVINKNKLSLLNNITGKIVAEFEFEKDIKSISDYDKIFKCVYVITDNKLIKLTIKPIL